MINPMLLDANSIGFAAQNGTKLTVGERQVQAIFGFLRSLRGAVQKFPNYKPIVLWDGKAKWRFDLFPGYKDRTGKDSKMDAMRESYQEQRPDIARALKYLGVTQAIVLDAEADDLAAQMSMRYSKMGSQVLLVTGDKDWMQLIDENVRWYEHRQERSRIVSMHNFFDETGCKTPSIFVQNKALMGDSSDTIPGVGGIGEKGAAEFLAEFGSVDNFFRLADAGELPKKLSVVRKRFANNERPLKSKKYGEMPPMRDAYYRNLKLMDLKQAPEIKPSDMRVTKGSLDVEAFAQFCEEMFFRSILSDINNWVEPFKEVSSE